MIFRVGCFEMDIRQSISCNRMWRAVPVRNFVGLVLDSLTKAPPNPTKLSSWWERPELSKVRWSMEWPIKSSELNGVTRSGSASSMTLPTANIWTRRHPSPRQTIHYKDGMKIKFELTVVDTPGDGGVDHDQEINRLISEFVSRMILESFTLIFGNDVFELPSIVEAIRKAAIPYNDNTCFPKVQHQWRWREPN